MKLEKITMDDVEKILDIYIEVCNPGAKKEHFHIDTEDLQQRLQIALDEHFSGFRLQEGYRIGSQYTAHSKLAFEVDWEGNFKAIMKPNLDNSFSYEKKLEKKAYACAEEFSRRVEEYFIIQDAL